MTSENELFERQCVHRDGAGFLVHLADVLRDIQSAADSDDALNATLRYLHELTGATSVICTLPPDRNGALERALHFPDTLTNGTRPASVLTFPVEQLARGALITLSFTQISVVDAGVRTIAELLIDTFIQSQEWRTQTRDRSAIVATGNELSELLCSIQTVDDVRRASVQWIGSRLNADHCLLMSTYPDPVMFPGIQPHTHSWNANAEDSPPSIHDIVAMRSSAHHGLYMGIKIDAFPDVELHVIRNDSHEKWTSDERATVAHLATIIQQHLNRTRISQEALRRPHNLHAVQQIASTVTGARDLGELYSMMHTAVARLIPLDTFLLALRRPGNDIVTMVYRAEGHTIFPQRTALPAFEEAMELARPLVVDDIIAANVPHDQRFGNPQKHVRSAVSAPLISEGVPIGLITLQHYDAGVYDWATAQLLESVALSVVGTFERLMLLEQLERQTRRDMGLRRVAEKLGNTLDTDQLIAIAREVIDETIPNDLVLVFVVDRHSRRVLTASCRSSEPTFKPPVVGHEMKIHSLSMTAIGASEQIIEPDYGAYARREHITWPHSGPAVATPIAIDEHNAGMILLARKETDSFEPDDLSLIRQIAAMLSTALQNTVAHAERLRYTTDLIELQALSSTIAAQLDLQKSLDAIVQAAPRLIDADSCAVGMLDGPDMLRVAATGSVALSIPDRIPLQELMVDETMNASEPVVLDDIRSHGTRTQSKSQPIPNTRGWLAMSLVDSDGHAAGLICLMTDEPRIWTERERSLLATLATAAALAIENARHFERTRDLLTASVESLAAAVEAKDPLTQNHSRQVAIYGRRIAEALGLDDEDVGHIELAGLLHDVGKIGIPDSVLGKPGPLDGAGWAAMQLHPVIGEQILAGNPILNPLLALVRHHHERWDGHGYPDMLRAHDIPLGASIISLAEALDTMTSHRPYRTASGWDDSIAEIESCRGSQFAPHVVDALLRSIASGTFDTDIQRLRLAGPAAGQIQQPRSQPLDMRALRIFDEVAQEIRAGTDLATFISRIVHTLNDVLEISFAALFLVDEESGDLVLMEMLSNTTNKLNHEGRIPIGRGIVGWVAEHGLAQNIADVHVDPRFIGVAISHPTRSELTVPLIAEGRVIGVLNLESDRVGAFSEMDERLLESTAGHLANAIHVIRLHERLKKLAVTDALTSLHNHHALFNRLVDEVSAAAEAHSTFSIAILDVNNLKAINDTYGHLTGDAALRAVAEVLTRNQREHDVVSRYGGDEFALILPGTSNEDAWPLLDRISAELRVGEFETDDVTFPLPTASWGIATYPIDGQRPTELLSVADGRMYQQKQATRL